MLSMSLEEGELTQSHYESRNSWFSSLGVLPAVPLTLGWGGLHRV